MLNPEQESCSTIHWGDCIVILRASQEHRAPFYRGWHANARPHGALLDNMEYLSILLWSVWHSAGCADVV